MAVFPFAQEVENLKQPECTLLNRADKHSCWRVTYCKLAGAWFTPIRKPAGAKQYCTKRSQYNSTLKYVTENTEEK